MNHDVMTAVAKSTYSERYLRETDLGGITAILGAVSDDLSSALDRGDFTRISSDRIILDSTSISLSNASRVFVRIKDLSDKGYQIVKFDGRGRSVKTTTGLQYAKASTSLNPARFGLVRIPSEDVIKVAEELYMLSTLGSDVEFLRFAFGEIEKAFAKKNLAFVNTLLAEIDPSRLKSVGSIGIARVTARASDKLAAWKPYVARVWSKVSASSLNAQHLMRGLVPADDSTLFASEQSIS